MSLRYLWPGHRLLSNDHVHRVCVGLTVDELRSAVRGTDLVAQHARMYVYAFRIAYGWDLIDGKQT